ncbi:MAG: thioredoxin family protein [Crocinitomicaceae bacterium]|nr:thioredoxin family protein [Crocinitomicaceae bacterium]
MIKSLLPIVFLAFSLFSFGQINFQSLSIDEAIAKAKTENKKVFIDIYTTWCGPCKILDRNVFKNTGVGERVNPDFIAIKVDAERYPDQSRLVEFNIRAYPTMIVLDGDGKQLKKFIGNMSVGEFHDKLDLFIDPALLPKNIALKDMQNNPEDIAIWRKSMAVLLNKDRSLFRENTQAFVDQFGLEELNNYLDSNIFYNAVLPLNSKIVQRVLSDPDYMYYSHEMYYKIDLKERARTATTEAEYVAIVEEAKASEEQRFIDYNGDYATDTEFLESLTVEKLNPVYAQEPEVVIPLSRKERRKLKKAERRQKRKDRKNK